jgi:formyltetrahydrofolate deformylase
MPASTYVLTLSCQNRPGIVAAVATYLFEHGGDIREAQQFDDGQTGKFFARIAFDLAGSTGFEELRAGFTP